MEDIMNEKLKKVIEKLETTIEKTTDYVGEHPIKSLVIIFVAEKIMKWLKD